MKKLIVSWLFVLCLPAMAWQPSKPIEVLIAWPPGSGNDIVFRALAPIVETKHGVKFLITNRPGAGGVVGTEQFSRMPADGYHINVVSLGGLTAMDRTFPVFADRAPYTIHSFDYVTMLAAAPLAFITARDDAVSTPKDLINTLKTASVTVADSGGAGRLSLETVLFRSGAKNNTQLTRVEHKGPTQTVTDVGGKHVRFGVIPLSVAAPFHLDPNGRIKIVALTSKEPHPALPEVGVINHVVPVVVEVPWALMVPKGTPREAIEWYARVFREAIENDQSREIWRKNFIYTDLALTNPTALSAHVHQMERDNRAVVDIILKDLGR